LTELAELSKFRIDRCFKECYSPKQVQIHFFADALQAVYGVVAYLRMCDSSGNVKCSFLIGKARLAPMKSVSIPRLELIAACLAVKLNQMMKSQLKEPNWETFF